MNDTLKQRIKDRVLAEDIEPEAVDCLLFDIAKMVDLSVADAVIKGCHLGEILEALGLRII